MRALLTLLLLLPSLALADMPRITAVTGPLAAMASELVGDLAEVDYPIPEGTDPALWRPSVPEITRIQESDLILLNGAGLSAWTTKTSLPRAKTVDTSKAFADSLITTEEAVTHSHGADGEHSHTGTAPQVWLDFAQAGQQATAIANALRRVLPGDADTLAANLQEVQTRLQSFDARAKALSGTLAGQTALAAHPGLEYFARAYGLDLAQLTWTPGMAPSPDDLAALDALIAADAPQLILWQSDPSPEALKATTDRGLTSVILDPATDDPQDYWALMETNLANLEAAAANF
ncbi:MAG: metal ABC transporter substrate-binding protein [Pseudomonadota bacterium]